MAAGFTLNKSSLKDFENYILEDFLKSNTVNHNNFHMNQKFHHSHLTKIFMII